MSDEIVPLISSSVAGPLGVLHLPRLWLKILLHAYGRLAEGYRHGSGGFDEITCVNLGLDGDALVEYIERERPDYLQLEAWVRANAPNLTSAAIAAHNQRIRNGVMREELAAERRARFGIGDPAFANAVALNDLDDWAGAHERLVSQS